MTPAGRGRFIPRGCWAPLLLGLLGSACRDTTPLQVDWPAGLDVAALVHGDDTRLELLGVVAIEDGLPRRAGQSLLVPEDEEDRIRLIGWSKEALGAHLPELDPDRWWDVDVALDPEACPSGQVVAEGARRVELSRLDPSVFEFDPVARRFVPGTVSPLSIAGLVLEFPLRPNGCDAILPKRWSRLDEEVFPPNVRIDGEPQTSRSNSVFGFNRVARIGPDQVVVMGVSHLLHLTRGRPFADTPEENLRPNALPAAPPGAPGDGTWLFTGLAVDPRTIESELRTIFLTAIYRPPGGAPNYGGGVFEIDVSARGFAGPVRTATAFAGGRGRPEAITVDGDGSWVAVGSTGLILSYDAGTGAIGRENVGSEPWFRRVIGTQHPRARHLAGSEEGFVAFGDLRGPLDAVTVGLPAEVATSVRGLSSVTGSKPRALINTFASGAFELGTDGNWTRVGFQTVGQLGCTSMEDACGFRTLGAGPLASPRRDATYSFSDRCGDLTVVDLEFRCASAVTFGLDNMVDLQASHGILTSVGDEGRVLELFFEE